MKPGAATALLVLLLAGPSPAGAEDPWKTLEGKPPDEWLSHAEKCRNVDTEESLYRAKLIYESLARVDSTPEGIDAGFELAMFHQSGRFGSHAHRAAAALLRNLADRFDHEQSKKFLEKLGNQWAGPKESEIAAARTAMSAGLHPAALDRLSNALCMPFPVRGPVGEEIDSKDILALMASIWGAASAGVKAARNMPDFQCRACNREGYVTCPRCKGKGRIHGWTVTGTGEREYGQGKCPDCRGQKKIRCAHCSATGISPSVLDPEERKSIAAIMPRILPLCETKSLAEAGLNSSLLALQWGLSFPPSVKPDDVESRRMVPFPGEKGIHPDFAQKWKEGDAVYRLNLLMDIAILTAKQSAALHVFSRCPLPEGSGDSPGMDDSPVLPLAVVQAFPDRFNGRWLAVRASFGSTEPSEIFEGMREIIFLSGDRSSLSALAWSEGSKPAHEYAAAMLRGAKWVDCYAKKYDYAGLNRFLDAAKQGSEVVVTGRLRHDPDTWPQSVFEVWSACRLADFPAGSGVKTGEPGRPKKPGAGTADPMAYLRNSPSFAAFKAQKSLKPVKILDAGLARLAASRDAGLGSAIGTDRSSAWNTAFELEQARSCFEALRHRCPDDALADELITGLAERLIELYMEIGRK